MLQGRAQEPLLPDVQTAAATTRAQLVGAKVSDIYILVHPSTPVFVTNDTCEAVLGISERVFRRVAKKLPHRREGEKTLVVRYELIVEALERDAKPNRYYRQFRRRRP